jgi:hypothetical protein
LTHGNDFLGNLRYATIESLSQLAKLMKRGWWIVACVLAGAWLIWFSGADELVIEDWPGRPTIPFEITENVKLARSWEPFSRGSLRLACTATRELRLVLQLVSPDQRLRPQLSSQQALEEQLMVPGELDISVGIDAKNLHSLPFRKAQLASIRSVDTIVFEPFSIDDTNDLAAWMDEAWWKRFSFGYQEHQTFMRGFTPGNEVRDLARRCSSYD